MINIVRNPYKSIVVTDENDEDVLISEGDKIKFCTEAGELKQGTITKFQSKEDKLKIQIMPVKGQCEELWMAAVIAEGSLVLDIEE